MKRGFDSSSGHHAQATNPTAEVSGSNPVQSRFESEVAYHRALPQQAEGARSDRVQSEFESPVPYQILTVYPNGRGVALRTRSVLVRIQRRSPKFPSGAERLRHLSYKEDFVGSSPTSGTTLRVSSSGRASVFQTDDESSILSTRPKHSRQAAVANQAHILTSPGSTPGPATIIVPV